MLELRDELGIVLSVIHFNHKIRGREGDADAEFVAGLAKQYRLEFRQDSGNVPAYAKKNHLSTEAAARRLRYEFFRKLLADGIVDKIATAHTRDDQAETVLLRVLRGTGTRGLAGIHPILRLEQGAIIRPMLEISRAEVEEFLNSLDQPWREDLTNADVTYTRNRIRHELLPLLERDYNPNIREVLAEAAEVARDEDAFWEAFIEALARAVIRVSEEGATLQFEGEATQSPAVRRRLLRQAADRSGLHLDFDHVEQLLELIGKPKGVEVELPRGWRARCNTPNSIRLSRAVRNVPTLRAESGARNGVPCGGPELLGYEYPVTIPCEVEIAPVRTLVRLSIVHGNSGGEMYNPASLLDASRLAAPLVLRNWRAGDRMRPLHRGSEEKLKRLFQEKKIPAESRTLWPVLTSAGRVLWAKELGVAAEFAACAEHEAVKIEIEEKPKAPAKKPG